MTEQEQRPQGGSDAPDAEGAAPLTDWEKLEALEEQERKKTRPEGWLEDPRIGGDSPQTPG